MKVVWVVKIAFSDNPRAYNYAYSPNVSQGLLSDSYAGAHIFATKAEAEACAVEWCRLWERELATATPRRLP